METGIVPGVRKIAILRVLVLGDMIFILPALDALHRAYPEAALTLIARPWAVDFFAGRIPGVTRIIGLEEPNQMNGELGFLIRPEDTAWFFPEMRAERFDLGISMQGGGKNSNPMIRQMQPRVSVGIREEGAVAPDRWFAFDYYQHEVSRNLDLAALAGAQGFSREPRLAVLPSDREAARPYLEPIRQPYAVIHSGARDVRRMWPPEKFARVADQIKRALGLEIVLTGSRVDGDAPRRVASAMQETSFNLSSQVTLPALVGVLESASLVVSNDTGIMHLALAVGAKTVGLFWEEYISKSMPLTRQNFYPLIAWGRSCPGCGKTLDQKEVVNAAPHPCRHLFSFVESIAEDDVFTAAQRLASIP
jgi:ADP-heptose:LPS heptosyltransferase